MTTRLDFCIELETFLSKKKFSQNYCVSKIENRLWLIIITWNCLTDQYHRTWVQKNEKSICWWLKIAAALWLYYMWLKSMIIIESFFLAKKNTGPLKRSANNEICDSCCHTKSKSKCQTVLDWRLEIINLSPNFNFFMLKRHIDAVQQ